MARDAPVIDAFGEGGFRLAGAWHAGSVLILSDLAQPWPVNSAADVTVEVLQPVLAAGRAATELLLLGMGPTNALPPRAVREAFLAAGIGLEFMATSEAARLYNLLTAEGRQLACALIAI